MAEHKLGVPKDKSNFLISYDKVDMDHLPPPPIGLKYLVYFLCCQRPYKLWVAWPVEEMRQDRKEIEMGPPGLSATLKESPSHAFKSGTPGFWGPCKYDLLARR